MLFGVLCLVAAVVRLELCYKVTCSWLSPVVLQTMGEEKLLLQQTSIKKLLEDDGYLLSGCTTAVRCLVCCLAAVVVQLEVTCYLQFNLSPLTSSHIREGFK